MLFVWLFVFFLFFFFFFFFFNDTATTEIYTLSLHDALPIVLTDLVDHVTASGLDGLGDRLIRTILGVWDSDLQPSLVGAVRTALTDPGLTRSISEFLTLEVIGRILRTMEVPDTEASRRAGL